MVGFVVSFCMTAGLLTVGCARNQNPGNEESQITPPHQALSTATLDVSLNITTAPSSVPTTSPTMQTVTTIEPTHTRVPLHLYTPNPPPQLAEPILEDFFFGGISVNCPLPCWNGLRVSESDLVNVQQVFDSVFGFDGRDILEDPVGPLVPIPPAGYDVVAESWIDESYGLDLLFHFDNDTQTLQSISFDWATNSTKLITLTPDRLVKEIGVPDQMLVRVQPGQAQSNDFRLALLYPEIGLTALYFGGIDGDLGDRVVCLNDRSTFGHGKLLITMPYRQDLTKLTDLQRQLIGSLAGYLSIDEATNTSLDQMKSLALDGQDICLTLIER